MYPVIISRLAALEDDFQRNPARLGSAGPPSLHGGLVMLQTLNLIELRDKFEAVNGTVQIRHFLNF